MSAKFSVMHGRRRIDAADGHGHVYAYLSSGVLEVSVYGRYFSWGYSPQYLHGEAAAAKAAEVGISDEMLAMLIP
jgi:hypothetical protein